MDWKDSDSAKYLLKWADDNHTEALLVHAKAEANEVGRKARERYWEEENKDVIGFNPYRGNEEERNLKAIERAYDEVVVRKKILVFLRERICNLVE
jgi:hypothetical protein